MNLLAQRYAFYILHCDEVRAVVFTNLKNLGNVGMAQRRRRLRFPNEALHAVAMRRDLSGEDLQSYFAIEFGILRQINLTHATRAEFGDDAIVGEIRAGEQFRHVCLLERYDAEPTVARSILIIKVRS